MEVLTQDEFLGAFKMCAFGLNRNGVGGGGGWSFVCSTKTKFVGIFFLEMCFCICFYSTFQILLGTNIEAHPYISSRPIIGTPARGLLAHAHFSRLYALR